jgi:hypothetical protein
MELVIIKWMNVAKYDIFLEKIEICLPAIPYKLGNNQLQYI